MIKEKQVFISRTTFYSLVNNTESFALYFKVGVVNISIVVREDLNDFEKKLHVNLDCTDNHKIYFIDEDTYNNVYSFIRDELEKFSRKMQHEIEERNDMIAQIQEFM